jgi:His/Glu/Gln/Arg/opine family amino acid ABC transporter permease subunit
MTAAVRLRRIAPARGTLIAIGIVLALVVFFVVTGRVDTRKWAVFVVPTSLRFLGEGLLRTLLVASVSLLLSVLFGVLLGMARSELRGPARWLVAAPIELVRATPILAILLVVLFLLLGAGIREATVAGILGLSIYNSAVIAEIVRAGISSIPRGEVEAARSLGLDYGQAMRSVVLPQALARMTPALVSQLITLIKDTSLLFIIGASELLGYGRQFTNFYSTQVGSVLLEVYLVIAVLFFLINYPLSRFSRRLESRQPADQRLHIVGEEDQALVAATAAAAARRE